MLLREASRRFACRGVRGLREVKSVAQCSYSATRQTAARPRQVLVQSSFSTLEAPYSQKGQRLFADFSVYKGKGAMKTKLISPTWKSTGNGLDQTVDRQGALLLEFAEPLPGTGAGPGERRYDWERKQTFRLSALELGAILDPNPSGEKMYHDPFKGKSNEGTIQKSMSLDPLPDSSSWYFGLAVTEAGRQTKIGVSISRHEMAVLRSLAQFLIPHLLGFDEAATPSDVGSSMNGHDSHLPVGAPPF